MIRGRGRYGAPETFISLLLGRGGRGRGGWGRGGANNNDEDLRHKLNQNHPPDLRDRDGPDGY